ncbi:hypothetical protein Clacol_003963 [Clathrus columnatus]|uniref:Uncharacterized protein n=1 Tax=Clathrus columnatus TaxID=1419009 RepID=A0AAV5A943_9AGAM|nr:hypothetical protein Clacol_003963 [Clathrus columnatus]
MAEIQREAEFLGVDESKNSDETVTLQRVDKSMTKKLSSEDCTLTDTDLGDYSLGKLKTQTFSSSSIDCTAILDFPCSLSSFPASFLLETYKSKSIPEAPLSSLVSAFPSSQALGITVSCSMQKLVQSDLPSEKSLTRSLHNPLASVPSTADTFTSICERPSAPAPRPSENGLRVTRSRSSAALNILRKARSNLKLLSFRSLRNLAKMKIESDNHKVPDLSNSTNPRETNESPVQNLPPIASVVSKSPHFISWFPFSEIDSPLRQSESPLSITPSPSCAVPGSESIEIDHSETNRGFLSPPGTTLYARQNAQTLRGYRRERVAEIHSFQRLRNGMDVINTFLENTAEMMVDGSSDDCHLDACTLISSPTKSEGDIAIPEPRVSTTNDPESVVDIMTTLVFNPDGNESINKPKTSEENYKKKQGVWSKFGLGPQKPKLCDDPVFALPLTSHLSVSMTGSRLNGAKANPAGYLSGERPTKVPVPKMGSGSLVGSRLGSDGCSAPMRYPLHIFTSARNKVLKTTRMLSTKARPIDKICT